MDLPSYLRLLRSGWPVLVAFVLAGVLGAAGIDAVRHDQYSATAEAYVSTGTANGITDLSQGTTFLQQAVKSYATLATTQTVLDPVISDLGLNTTSAKLAENVFASAPLDTAVIDIRVTDPDPARAAAIANAVTRELAHVVLRLTPSRSAGTITFTQVETATPPTQPSSPDRILDLLIGGLLGLALGVAAVFLRRSLDTRLKEPADVEAVVDEPVLGVVPLERRFGGAVADAHRPARAEAYGILRTNLQFARLGRADRPIIVTSALPGDGKTSTSVSLALSAAEAGHTVVLVDADLRRPTVASAFGLDGTVGLTDVLVGSVRLEEALQTTSTPGLHILPAGTVPPNPVALLESTELAALIGSLTERFDLVILDTPPVLPVADASILLRHGGSALVVASANRTRRRELGEALARLHKVDADVLGVLLNRHRTRSRDRSRYESYYVPGTAPEGRGTKPRRGSRPPRAAADSADGLLTRAAPPAEPVLRAVDADPSGDPSDSARAEQETVAGGAATQPSRRRPPFRAYTSSTWRRPVPSARRRPLRP